MSFLKCTPCVCVIKDEYEILVNTRHRGIIAVEVAGIRYDEDNSGVLYSEKNYAKIRIPAKALDEAQAYTVNFCRTIARRAYYSEMAAPQQETFRFKPLLKDADIHIYHIADVHNHFAAAKEAGRYFGEDTDLFILNGDISEVETKRNFFDFCRFAGDLSGGAVPILFSRGNHDTRGRLAERFTDYLPADGKKTYYPFKVGKFWGVILDCGEDKKDDCIVYGGTNRFHQFRLDEREYLKTLTPDGEIRFAISHICPSQTTETKGCGFDIERTVYRQWNRELKRLGIQFMVCGHIHRTYLLPKNSDKCLIPNPYPVIVGSANFGEQVEDIWGTAITVNADRLDVRFTDSRQAVREAYTVDLKTGGVAPAASL